MKGSLMVAPTHGRGTSPSRGASPSSRTRFMSLGATTSASLTQKSPQRGAASACVLALSFLCSSVAVFLLWRVSEITVAAVAHLSVAMSISTARSLSLPSPDYTRSPTRHSHDRSATGRSGVVRDA